MNAKLIFLIIPLLVLFFFSGCVDQKLKIEDRLACINLTSKSFAAVPSCNSIEECFSSVDSSFNFPEENFSPRVNQKIFSYKNHLANSWLYYNRALKSIKAIHKICVSEKNTPNIPKHLNELNNHLTKAFQYANNANRMSFSILLLEKQIMLEEEIDLIKEENLYSDFVLIQNNLNEFSQKEFLNSDSYFSHYASVLQEFNSLSKKFGFQPVIIEEYSLMDLLDASDESLLKEAKKQNNAFYIPLLSDFVSGIVSYLNNLLKLKQSVSILQQFPAFEFLQTYSDLVGEKNSVSEHFISILKQNALHRKSIAERNSATISEINSLLSQTQEKINLFSEKQFGEFDSDFLNQLYMLLDENRLQFSSDSFTVSQLSEINTIAQQQLDSLSLEFSSLMHNTHLQKISLGKLTAKLKLLKNSLLELNSNIEFLKNNSLDTLLSLCSKRISLIEEKLPKNANTAKAQNSLQKITFNLKQFHSSSEITSSLWLCKTIVTEFNSLNRMLENSQKYENDLNAQCKECLSFLEKIFSNHSIPQELFSHKNQWAELLKEKDSFEEIEFLSNKCHLLKEQVNLTLNEAFNAEQLEEKFSSAKDSLAKLTTMNSFFPEILPEKQLYPLQKEFTELKKHFSSTGIDWSNSLQNISTLKRKTQEINSSLKKILQEKLVSLLKKTAKYELFPTEVPELNKDYNFLTRISFSNPFQDFQQQFSFSLLFPSNNTKTLLKKSSNISQAVFSENHLLLDLNSLPAGETFIEFHSTQRISSSNSTELISFSPEKALFKKLLTIDSNFSIPKLKLLAELNDFGCSIGEIFIYSKEKQLSYSLENKKLIFFDEDIFPKKTIEIYYELKNPVEKQLSFKNSTTLDSNTTLLKYFFTLKNKLPYPLKNPNIPLPLTLEKDSVFSLTSFDSLGNEFPTQVQSNKPLLKIPLLEKNSLIKGELWIKVNNLSMFWKDLIEKAEAQLYSIPKNSSKIEEKSENISRNISALKEFPFSEKNLKELQNLEQQTQALEEEEKENSLAIEKFLSLKKQAKEKLQEFSDAKQFLQEYTDTDLTELFQENFEKYTEAEKLFSQQEYKKALSTLSESLTNPANEKLQQVKNSLIEELSASTSEVEKTFFELKKLSVNSAELQNKKQQLFSNEKSIREKLAKDSFPDLKEKMQEFHSNLKAFNSAKNTATQKRSSFIKEKINSFLKMLQEPEELSLLEKELSSVSEEQLIKAHYLLPIQKKDFEKIKNSFLKIKNSSLAKSLKEIQKQLNSNDSNNSMPALKKFNKIEKELNSSYKELLEQKQQIKNAYSTLKNDAVSSINSLSSKNISQELLPSYNKALHEFKENNLLKTITITGMLSAIKPNKNENFLPTAIIPIAIALAFLLFLKIRKKRRKTEKKKIVPSHAVVYS